MIVVHDMAKAKRLYADLLGATFIDADWTGEPSGINVSIAWDAGSELCAPMPVREADSAISSFLAQCGEGVMHVFFDVDDGDAALARAAAHGFGCVNALDYSQGEIDAHLGGRFSRYQELTLDAGERRRFAVTLARIDRKTAA